MNIVGLNNKIFSNRIYNYQLLFISLAFFYACNTDSKTISKEKINKEEMIADGIKTDKEYLTKFYKSTLERNKDNESAFMNSFFIGMDQVSCQNIAQYLVLSGKLKIHPSIEKNKTFTGCDYEKIPFDFNCDPGCLIYNLDGIEEGFILKLYWDFADKTLTSLECTQKKTTDNDYKYLTFLYQQKYGKPVEVKEIYNMSILVFKTKEHSIELSRDLKTDDVIISYTNHLIEQQKIEKEELMRKTLEKSMENVGKKKLEENLDKI